MPAAASKENDYTFDNQPLPYIAQVSNNNVGIYVYDGYYSTSTPDAIIFAGAAKVGNRYDAFFFSLSNSASLIRSNLYADNYLDVSNWQFDADYAVWVTTVECRALPGGFQVPVYSSYDELAVVVNGYLSQYQPPAVPVKYRFAIPAGYVAYIKLDSFEEELRIDATMPKNSAVLGDWWTNTTTIREGASYPTSGQTFPNSNASRLNWIRNVTGGTNLIGQTKSASYIYQPTSNMIEIYNPYHYDGRVAEPLSNPTLYVTCYDLSDNGVRFYPLADDLTIQQGALGIGSSSPDGYTDYIESANTPPENPPEDDSPVAVDSFKDQDDNPVTAPTPGGYNEPFETESISDILQNFFNSFLGIFTEGHNAIRNLVENASQFVSRLSSLYSWLPPQVLGVLTSAIILAIIIGVLKVFL